MQNYLHSKRRVFIRTVATVMVVLSLCAIFCCMALMSGNDFVLPALSECSTKYVKTYGDTLYRKSSYEKNYDENDGKMNNENVNDA